jgi:integrase/recombinase XerC
MTTIQEAVEQYLESVAAARSPRTARAYRSGMEHFRAALVQAKIDPEAQDVAGFSEGQIALFIKHISRMSPATQALYLTAARGFYHFLAAERLADPNLPRLQELVRRRARRQGRRIPQFPRTEIEQLIAYAENLAAKPVTVPEPAPDAARPPAARSDRRRARLRNLRDRALILFLADTGLRISEACSLTLGDVDFHEARLTVIGKGDQQALVRISRRALDALREYLTERQGSAVQPTGQKRKSQPLFTRHDRGSGKGEALRPLDSSSAWDLVRARAAEAVGEAAAAQIHPHSFRHYFVTVVLLATNNLEKTRRLARHKSITVTQRYAEIDPELDQDYYEIFDGGGKG